METNRSSHHHRFSSLFARRIPRKANPIAPIALFLLTTLALPLVSAQAAMSTLKFQLRNPLPAASWLDSVIFANGKFWVVGDQGLIVATTDGISGDRPQSGTSSRLYGIAYSGSMFVAVGANGTIVTSPDGTTWTAETSGTSDQLNSVGYGNGIFVAVSQGGAILTSSDGVTWTPQSSPTTKPLRSVTYADSQFVIVGGVANSPGIILTSTDGSTWTPRTSNVGQNLNGIAFGNNQFIAVGESGVITTSPDGITWTSQSSGVTAPLEGINSNGSLFVAVGFSGTIITSTDGITWTTQTGSGSIFDVASGNGTFLAVGFQEIFTSTDAVTWNKQSAGPTDDLSTIAYGNGTYVAAGPNGVVVRGSGGLIWEKQSSGITAGLDASAYGAGVFVLGGSNGTIISSSDGTTWTSETSGTTSTIATIGYISNEFIAVTSDGSIITSPDGVTWTAASTESTVPNPLDLAFGNNTYVLVGTNGAIATSGNLTTWTPATTGTSVDLNAVTYTGTQFVAVGASGTIMTSSDGSTWTGQSSGTTELLTAITSGSNYLVAVGYSGTVIDSIDGTTWAPAISPTTIPLYAVTYGNGSFIAAGSSGTVISTTISAPKPLVNISTRGEVGTGPNVLIAGFVISGNSSDTKQVLVRAVGPSLANNPIYGLSDADKQQVLIDPQLTVYDSSGNKIISNDNWGNFSNQTELANDTKSVGAPAFVSADDAAAVVDLHPGAYTVIISGVNNTTGVALAEVFDTAPDTGPKLVNISSRLQIKSGFSVAIAGFVIRGSAPKTVLIRAVGPSLGNTGTTISGTVEDPSITVYSGSNVIGTNDNWGTNPNLPLIRSVTSSVGAFSLNEGSKDAAGLFTLAPGPYTAVIHYASGTNPGIGLVEVYDTQ